MCLEGSRHLRHRTLFGAPKSLSQRLRCSGATWWQTAKCSNTSKPLRGAFAGGLADCPHFSSHLVIPWLILPKQVGVGQGRKPLPLRLLCFSSYFHEKANQAERGKLSGYITSTTVAPSGFLEFQPIWPWGVFLLTWDTQDFHNTEVYGHPHGAAFWRI